MTKTADRKWIVIGVVVAVLYLAGPKLFAPLFVLAGGLMALAGGLFKLGLVALALYAIFALVRRAFSPRTERVVAANASMVGSVPVAPIPDPEGELEREHRSKMAELDRELDRAIKEKAMNEARSLQS